MKLYSNCCVQRDYAVELLNDGRPDEAKVVLKAFEKFQDEKKMKRVSGNFDDWIDSRCKVKKTRARQLRTFYELFHPYKKVLGCRLPFIWFVRNGPTVVEYFESHREVAQPWTINWTVLAALVISPQLWHDDT